MNKLLGFINLLLADETDTTGVTAWLKPILDTIGDILNAIVIPVITIVATVGIIYSIVLGVNYAKAESSDQKEEAKKRIINVVVGAILMIVLMLLLYLFIGNAGTIFGWASEFGEGPSTPSTGKLFW